MGDAESQVRNLNCIRGQCGTSDGGYDHRQGFQKIDQAEIWWRVDSGKTRSKETRQAALPIGSIEDMDLR